MREFDKLSGAHTTDLFGSLPDFQSDMVKTVRGFNEDIESLIAGGEPKMLSNGWLDELAQDDPARQKGYTHRFFSPKESRTMRTRPGEKTPNEPVLWQTREYLLRMNDKQEVEGDIAVEWKYYGKTRRFEPTYEDARFGNAYYETRALFTSDMVTIPNISAKVIEGNSTSRKTLILIPKAVAS